MGRFTKDGKPKEASDSEEFYEEVHNAPPVECIVCGVRFGQGNKGQALHVCAECLNYVCSEHLWRHPNCSEGR